MKFYFLALLIACTVHCNAHFIDDIKKHLGIQLRPSTPLIVPLTSGPYKGRRFVLQDLVHYQSPSQDLFENVHRFPQLYRYIELVSKNSAQPILLREFLLFNQFMAPKNPRYKREYLFNGRVYSGILIGRENEKTCIHEEWFKK